MRILSLTLSIVACAVLTAGAGHAQTGKLPVHAAPSGFQSIEGEYGGRLLFGAISDQASGDAAFRTGLKALRGGYFDAAPNMASNVRSKDGNITIAPFTSTIGKAPVNGAVYSVSDSAGSAHVGILFDYTQNTGKSFNPLMARFADMIPGPAASSEFVTVKAPDGTDKATVPDNWQVPSLREGQLITRGPDQALVIIRYLTYFTDPRTRPAPGTTPLPYTSDPVRAMEAVASVLAARSNQPTPKIHVERAVPDSKPQGIVTSALLYGTAVLEGKTRRFETLVQVTPLDASGRWIVQVN